MIRIAVIGAGYWGKNLVRTFASLPGAHLAAVCDTDVDALDRVKGAHPAARIHTSYERMLEQKDIDAVVLATPAITHADLARKALRAGKDVYVEKPIALSVEDAADLVRLAREGRRILMAGHLMVYHPAVRWVADRLRSGELGDVHYLYFQRLNLGIVRRDENAWWSLAPHDVSMALLLLGRDPVSVSARGACYLRPGIEDVVFANLTFAGGQMAQIHVSWLDPHKIRKMTVVGSRRMVVFDDTEASEKIKLFDRGADRRLDYETYGDAITLRQGDIWIPQVPMSEPLKAEASHFVECVRDRKEPETSGLDGLRVVRVLDAVQRSLERGGEPAEPAAVPDLLPESGAVVQRDQV